MTFETFNQYRRHMDEIHNHLPIQKRKVKLIQMETSSIRSVVAKKRHEDGAFLNTHIKRDTLKAFIRIYDEFITDLFRSDEYDGSRYRRLWFSHFRISPNDLDECSLEAIIESINAGYISRSRSREARHREFDDMFE
jgi:hypothetical protein